MLEKDSILSAHIRHKYVFAKEANQRQQRKLKH